MAEDRHSCREELQQAPERPPQTEAPHGNVQCTRPQLGLNLWSHLCWLATPLAQSTQSQVLSVPFPDHVGNETEVLCTLLS